MPTETQFPVSTEQYHHSQSGWGSWSDIANVTADDSSDATTLLTGGQRVRCMRGYNFGFTMSGATAINTCTIKINRYNAVGAGGDFRDDWVTIEQNKTDGSPGDISGDLSDAGAWPLSMTEKSYVADVNPSIAQATNSTFGVGLAVLHENDTGGDTARVDYFKVEIDYAVAASGGGNLFVSPFESPAFRSAAFGA